MHKFNEIAEKISVISDNDRSHALSIALPVLGAVRACEIHAKMNGIRNSVREYRKFFPSKFTSI